jgi:lipoprotein LpqH
MSLDQITGITVLTFSEQNAVVTLEFDGPYGKLEGLPTELIDSVARRQLEILTARLPEIAPPAPLPVAATIGGEPVDVRGPVVCKYWNGRSTITTGNSVLKIVVELEPDASVVHRVELANVDDVYLSSLGNMATATKAGNTYTVIGTASGESDTNPPTQVTKPFEISLTCP